VRFADGYRITHESHADDEALHRFERQSSTLVVPADWVRPERWKLDPSVSGPVTRHVFWSAGRTLSRATIRGGLIAEAGLQTQVALPVPNRGYLQQIVMLFDTVPRPANAAEMNALAIAVFLLGWAESPEPDAEPEIGRRAEKRSRLDAQSRRLIGPAAAVRLTVYEWGLLSALFERQGEAVSFRELTEEVWRAPEELVGRAVIYEVMARLRKHLSTAGGDYQITNVSGYGYCLEAVVAC
jgi:hypothetical protein